MTRRQSREVPGAIRLLRDILRKRLITVSFLAAAGRREEARKEYRVTASLMDGLKPSPRIPAWFNRQIWEEATAKLE